MRESRLVEAFWERRIFENESRQIMLWKI